MFYTGGVDYDSFNNTQVTLSAGETVVELNVTFVDDSFLESNETFSGTLSIVSGNSNVDSDTDTATVTILDEADSMLFLHNFVCSFSCLCLFTCFFVIFHSNIC